jgi:hypothetical protein
VNGKIAASGVSFSVPNTHREAFSMLVPEDSLRAGRNSVEILSIARGQSGVRLVRLGGIGA